MKPSEYEPYFPIVTEVCLRYHESRTPESANLWELLEETFCIDGLPMHCPVHHYIVPATLLTICRLKQQEPADLLKQDLEESLTRAKNILPGFCGFYGACGAAVGLGIFWSVITGSTPYSSVSWSYANRATGRALLEIADLGGPRCCKRTAFTALLSQREQLESLLRVDISPGFDIQCQYYENNKECLKDRCPFYLKEATA